MNNENLTKLINQAMAIEETEAKDANAIGFMSRILAQATMPHSDPKKDSVERINGNLSLTIIGHPKFGIPYGVYPRLLLAWLITEAVRTRSPIISLGQSLSDFMRHLGLLPTGGRWGTIVRLKDQMLRLFGSSIFCVYKDDKMGAGLKVDVVQEYLLWWDPTRPQQKNLWESQLTLNDKFFKEVTSNPIPIDLRALCALKSSAMALDLYCWLTYRFSYLKQHTEISWKALQNQFGANYAQDKKGFFEFKRKFLHQLRKVQVVYAGAQHVEIAKQGLLLKPASTHINKVKGTKKSNQQVIPR